jgi:anti-sigma B factor antagonist
MKISETEINDVTVTAIAGRVDTTTAGACETRLIELLFDGRKVMILDLAGVVYLSSAGIRVLVILFKKAAAARIPVALCCARDNVVELLEVTGLTRLMPPHPTIEAAIEATAK